MGLLFSSTLWTVGQEDPHMMVQTFINLIQRHEQMFYSFVHKVHSRGDGLFDNLMKWIELILAVMRDGLGQPVSLEYLLPHTGHERQDILKEIDEVATYHYKLKVTHEDKIRRRFGRTQGQNGADAEDQATAALVEGVVQDLSFGALIQGDADELAAEASSSEGDDYYDDDDDDGGGDATSSQYDSDESDSDDAGTSEDDLAHPPRRSRAKTLLQSSGKPKWRAPVPSLAPPKTKAAHEPGRPSAAASRQLRSSRSLNFHSGRAHLGSGPVPPVPPLPQKYTGSLSSQKDLPPVPLPSSTPSRGGNVVATGKGQTDNTNNKVAKRKKGAAQFKPPELHHIPQLLPVFIEMVRPADYIIFVKTVYINI
jgi:Domain of unknown function in PX-proteins (DUF3818)